MRLRTALELGRTSNLPTVVSNVIAGSVLAAASATTTERLPTLLSAVVAASAFYVGGMWLNDAFDAPWDRQHRPERPIPRGEVSQRAVFTFGTLLLALGFLLATLAAPPNTRLGVFAAAVGTAAAIVAYNRWHKGFAWAPVVMGACRVGVYALAALALTEAPAAQTWLAALAVGLYVVGLTHVARFETKARVARAFVSWLVFTPSLLCAWLLRQADSATLALSLVAIAAQLGWAGYLIGLVRQGKPRAIPRAVGGLIAGLALVDASFVASQGNTVWTLACWVCFAATLAAQRKIAGT